MTFYSTIENYQINTTTQAATQAKVAPEVSSNKVAAAAFGVTAANAATQAKVAPEVSSNKVAISSPSQTMTNIKLPIQQQPSPPDNGGMKFCKDIPGYILMNNSYNKNSDNDPKFNDINESIANCNGLSFDECSGVSYNHINNDPFIDKYYIINNENQKIEKSTKSECYYSRSKYINLTEKFIELLKNSYNDFSDMLNKYNIQPFDNNIDDLDKNNNKYPDFIELIHKIKSTLNHRSNNDKKKCTIKNNDKYYDDTLPNYNNVNDFGKTQHNINQLLDISDNIEDLNDEDFRMATSKTSTFTLKLLIDILINIYKNYENY